jgi:DNA processing protein
MVHPSSDPPTWNRLCLSMVEGVGPLAMQRLLEQLETPEHILRASVSELQSVEGIGPKVAGRIAQARETGAKQVDAQLALAREHRIDILLPDSDRYPRMLQEIHDPPLMLFVRGQIKEVDQLSMAIVGTRHASRYGLEQAERLAGSLARAGITIVSGLARGIDTAAHRGALAAGGRTLAVLASGVLNTYPPENKELASQIAAQGAVLGETPPTAPPTRGMFPQRNRIISGLSLGTIVVEAAHRSGALITARHAMEQGREVFAIPGPINSRMSQGPHALIRDGARLVTSVEDVLEELGPLVEEATREDGTTIRTPAELKLNGVEGQILQAIDPAGSLIDQVARDCELPVHRVLSTISVLEMRHLVRRLGGNRVARI